MFRVTRSVIGVALLVAATVSCATTGGPTELTVSVSASLVAPVERLVADFEAANPGIDIRVNPGGSGRLATQIIEGAPSDVAILADPDAMTSLADDDQLDGPPTPIAVNTLTMIVAPGNPLGVASLADLKRSDGEGLVSLCTPTAACGRATELLLTEVGVVVDERTVTRGPDVAATAAAVRRGDAAVAVVFRTDARAAGDEVTEIPITGAEQRPVVASAAALRRSPHPTEVRAFIALLTSPTGQTVFADAGFGTP